MINADCRSQIGKWLLLVTGIYQTIVTACAAPPLLACPVFRLDFTGLLYEVICGRPVLADNLSHLAFVSSNNARTSRSRHSLAVPDASRPIDWMNLFTLSCENSPNDAMSSGRHFVRKKRFNDYITSCNKLRFHVTFRGIPEWTNPVCTGSVRKYSL